MKLLGAILAGGASRRFGSDKTLAIIDGRPMLDHVAGRLRVQCDALVVVGRDWPGLIRVDDRPAPGLGPLGGLAGALAYAEDNGFGAVLTSGCDLPDLPMDLRKQLGTPNAVLRGQPTIGLWKSDLSAELAAWLAATTDLSIRAFANAVGARRVEAAEMPNINTQADLERRG
jgi:molybdopterin-guanine dinucleotide biosynthesis protein A